MPGRDASGRELPRPDSVGDPTIRRSNLEVAGRMKARMGVMRNEGGSAMPVRCDRCGAEFDRQEQLVTHVRDEQGQSWRRLHLQGLRHGVQFTGRVRRPREGRTRSLIAAAPSRERNA